MDAYASYKKLCTFKVQAINKVSPQPHQDLKSKSSLYPKMKSLDKIVFYSLKGSFVILEGSSLSLSHQSNPPWPKYGFR